MFWAMPPPLLSALWAAAIATAAHAAAPDPSWPSFDAARTLRVVKTSGLELETEPQWLHLHASNAHEVGLGAEGYDSESAYSSHVPGPELELRYSESPTGLISCCVGEGGREG